MGILGSIMSAAHAPIYRSRLRVLTGAIGAHLQPGDSVLDVGCGNGTLGKALLDAPDAAEGVTVRGLERVVRGGEPIEVLGYDGVTIPLGDDSVDVVIVADVLHHEEEPDRLMAECVRVARRLVVVKDHQIKGVLGASRVKLMDWAANAPYGVPCLFRYNTPGEWAAFRERHGLGLEAEHDGMRLYPPVVDQIFGGGLQYMAVYRVDGGMPVDDGAGDGDMDAGGDAGDAGGD